MARDIAIAAETGAPLHIQHVSTARSVDLIRDAKAAGLSVTAEVTPHHLALDESSVESLDPNLKMYPPLRAADDQAALLSALREGVIDAVATDHAPHTAAEKAVPFEEAPRGVIGLETAAAVVASNALGNDQRTFFQRMSIAPARIAGLDRQGRRDRARVTRQPGPLRPGSAMGPRFVRLEVREQPICRNGVDWQGAGNHLRRPDFVRRSPSVTTVERALLCTADGEVFRGRSVRRHGSHHRRGGLQHIDDRLSGDPDRPVIRGAGGRDDLLAYRQLRGARR